MRMGIQIGIIIITILLLDAYLPQNFLPMAGLEYDGRAVEASPLIGMTGVNFCQRLMGHGRGMIVLHGSSIGVGEMRCSQARGSMLH
jgi:hypothetical protein